MTRYVIEAYAQGEAGSLRAFAQAIAKEIQSLAGYMPGDAPGPLEVIALDGVTGTIRIRAAKPGEPQPKEEWREEDEAPPPPKGKK